MKNMETPDWLTDIQNRSWEPEILISGISVTSLFLFSDLIFNFFAMLIQEYGVRYVVGKDLYIVTLIMLNGLKTGLIVHLVLRGIWAGLIGLSYVFPHGVKKNPKKRGKNSPEYPPPETFVIRLEKICSLLFSFIFSSVMFIGTTTIVFFPIAILYMTGINVVYIKYIILLGVVPATLLFSIYAILSETVLKNSRFKLRLRLIFLDSIFSIYFSNLGIRKILPVFILYFAFISLLSLRGISGFDFNNENPTEFVSGGEMIELNNDHYLERRNNDLRVSKAAIGKFWIDQQDIKLFISYFREDSYTLGNLKSDITPLKKFHNVEDSVTVSEKSIYRIFIDDTEITELNLYGSELPENRQKGRISRISAANLGKGYHELRISKLLWFNKNKNPEFLDKWEVIPFELIDCK